MNVGAVLAYVGPGPGLTMVWAFIALLGTIGLAVLYLLFWPIRMLIRKIRGTPPQQGFPVQTNTPPESADPATKSQ